MSTAVNYANMRALNSLQISTMRTKKYFLAIKSLLNLEHLARIFMFEKEKKLYFLSVERSVINLCCASEEDAQI